MTDACSFSSHTTPRFQGLAFRQALFFGPAEERYRQDANCVESLEDKVARYIQVNGLFTEAGRILLAVSGGADSIALLHVMGVLASERVIQRDLLCVHVNHQLRGAASEADATFVLEQAEELNVPAVTQAIDVRAHADREKLSIETAGRQLRLSCLAQIARAEACTWLATGHQQDDNAETILHRLQRGTGFRGLAGIWPARQIADGLTLARPLLNCTRAEIVAYLGARGLPWREDHTNRDCVHRRNYIRHRLLPDLQSHASNSLPTQLAGLAESTRRLYERVAREVETVATEHVRADADACVIDASALAVLPEIVAVELVRHQLARLGCGQRNLTAFHYRSILALAHRDSGTKASLLPNGFSAHREYDHVVLRRSLASETAHIPTSDARVIIPGTTHLADCHIEAIILDGTEVNVARIKAERNPLRECFDLDRIEPPVAVRARRPGDRFQPLGMVAEKKMGKFLTTARIPKTARQRVLIVEDRARVVWVCPVRISEQVKVTDRTRRVLVLEICPKEVATDCMSDYK